jgi:hypothetical protein
MDGIRSMQWFFDELRNAHSQVPGVPTPGRMDAAGMLDRRCADLFDHRAHREKHLWLTEALIKDMRAEFEMRVSCLTDDDLISILI